MTNICSKQVLIEQDKAKLPSTTAASRAFTWTPCNGAPLKKYERHHGQQET